jgi:hypothetical protein
MERVGYHVPAWYRKLTNLTNSFYSSIMSYVGTRGSVVVKALCYKPEGCGFENHEVDDFFFNLSNPSGRTRAWSLLNL